MLSWVSVGNGVRIENTHIGCNCTIHQGVCIGQDGFGFILEEETGEHQKKIQALSVVVEDNVEIGTGTQKQNQRRNKRNAHQRKSIDMLAMSEDVCMAPKSLLNFFQLCVCFKPPLSRCQLHNRSRKLERHQDRQRM